MAESEIRDLKYKDKHPGIAEHDLTGHFTKLGGHSVATQVMAIIVNMEKVTLIEKLVLIVKHMASQSIKDNKRCFWVAIMARQAGIWSVIWLKCTENAQWLHVIF